METGIPRSTTTMGFRSWKDTASRRFRASIPSNKRSGCNTSDGRWRDDSILSPSGRQRTCSCFCAVIPRNSVRWKSYNKHVPPVLTGDLADTTASRRSKRLERRQETCGTKQTGMQSRRIPPPFRCHARTGSSSMTQRHMPRKCSQPFSDILSRCDCSLGYY